MDLMLKKRLVGASVLLGLAVVFIPMLFDHSGGPDRDGIKTNIPPQPKEGFSSRIIPLDSSPSKLDVGEASAGIRNPVQSGDPVTSGAPGPSQPGGKPSVSRSSTVSRSATGSPERVGVTAWIIQIGSFAKEENAAALQQRLRNSGYASFVETVYADAGKVFRVRVGPELLRSRAQGLRDKLESETRLKGIVMKYP